MNTLPSTAALRRLNPDAYLLAAELLDSHTQSFACNALWYATGHTDKDANKLPDWTQTRDAIPEVAAFTQVLKPADTCLSGWYGLFSEPDPYGCRILGLLLLRELVLDARRSRKTKGRTRS